MVYIIYQYFYRERQVDDPLHVLSRLTYFNFFKTLDSNHIKALGLLDHFIKYSL